MAADARAALDCSVLVYSDDAEIRERVKVALGRRPATDVVVSYVDAADGQEVVRLCDAQVFDLLILDGEAAPTGGMGLCRQLKDELTEVPPVLLLTGRRDDAWLATWSRADAAVPHPIDAVQLVDTALDLLRRGGERLPGRSA